MRAGRNAHARVVASRGERVGQNSGPARALSNTSKMCSSFVPCLKRNLPALSFFFRAFLIVVVSVVNAAPLPVWGKARGGGGIGGSRARPELALVCAFVDTQGGRQAS